MIDLREKGMSTVELLLALIIVGAIAAAGVWAFTQDDDDNDTNPSNGTSQQPSDPDPTPDPQPTIGIDSSQWTQVENSFYSVRVPDGWSLLLSDSDTILYTYEPADTNYTAGTAAAVRQETQQGTDVTPAFEMSLWGSSEPPSVCESGLTQPATAVASAIGSGITADFCSSDRSYFVTRAGGNGVVISYSADFDSSTDVLEAMLSTIRFN